MKNKDIDKIVEEIKTPCCNSDWYRKGRLDFRCKKCDKDITLDIILIYESLIK